MMKKDRSIVNLKSSEKLKSFLESNKLHKRDFAQMIGVTLSYVYNLIDDSIPFSTRSTTLERIATVLDILPEDFDEYTIPQEPILIDEAIEFIKMKLKEKNMPTFQFLKAFPRKKRVEIVDILRGAVPLPLDWKEINMICQILNIKKSEIYPFWEQRFKQLLENAGMNINTNINLINSMLKCAKDYIAK